VLERAIVFDIKQSKVMSKKTEGIALPCPCTY